MRHIKITGGPMPQSMKFHTEDGHQIRGIRAVTFRANAKDELCVATIEVFADVHVTAVLDQIDKSSDG